jgi:hypothetical protein
MAGSSQQSYSPPSSSQAHSPFAKTDPSPMGCEICGAPRAGFWLIVRRRGQVVASIARACPSCVEEAEEPSEDTTGASGLRASDAVKAEATTKRSTLRQELEELFNSCRAPGEERLIAPRLLDGRALSSLPEPFKTLLHGVYSNARDWLLGTRAAVAGGDRRSRRA